MGGVSIDIKCLSVGLVSSPCQASTDPTRVVDCLALASIWGIWDGSPMWVPQIGGSPGRIALSGFLVWAGLWVNCGTCISVWRKTCYLSAPLCSDLVMHSQDHRRDFLYRHNCRSSDALKAFRKHPVVLQPFFTKLCDDPCLQGCTCNISEIPPQRSQYRRTPPFPSDRSAHSVPAILKS